MDKVLKRRLVGASILIALAVIFVPMLLVDPDSIETGDGARVEIPPEPEDAGEVRRIPLDPEAARVRRERGARTRAQDRPDVRGGSPEASRAGDDPADEPAVPDDEIVLRPELAGDETSPDERDEPLDSGRAGPESANGTGPEREPAAEPAPEPDAGAASAGDAPAGESEAPATAAPAPSPDGDWVVQVASFGSADSAGTVQARLEALGHTVIRDEIVRGNSLLHRLRTGPYASETAANRAREQITATVRGVEPLVMQIDPETLDAKPGFAVQVGSFASEDNAENETARLSGLGFDAFRFSEEVGGRPIWRVLVGPVDSREAAERLKARVTEQAGVEGLVVSHP